jgi:hypothetical protein
MYGESAGAGAGVPDLDDLTLDELDELDSEELEPYITAASTQIKQPRKNLGGTGPPGRAD